MLVESASWAAFLTWLKRITLQSSEINSSYKEPPVGAANTCSTGLGWPPPTNAITMLLWSLSGPGPFPKEAQSWCGRTELTSLSRIQSKIKILFIGHLKGQELWSQTCEFKFSFCHLLTGWLDSIHLGSLFICQASLAGLLGIKWQSCKACIPGLTMDQVLGTQ